MLRYICQACQLGEHDLCAGTNPPPPGMLGGEECICDGKCGDRVAVPTGDLRRVSECADRLQAMVDQATIYVVRCGECGFIGEGDEGACAKCGYDGGFLATEKQNEGIEAVPVTRLQAAESKAQRYEEALDGLVDIFATEAGRLADDDDSQGSEAVDWARREVGKQITALSDNEEGTAGGR